MARLLKIVAGSEQLFKGYSKLFILSYALFISKCKFFRCKVDTSGVSARCACRKRGDHESWINRSCFVSRENRCNVKEALKQCITYFTNREALVLKFG